MMFCMLLVLTCMQFCFKRYIVLCFKWKCTSKIAAPDSKMIPILYPVVPALNLEIFNLSSSILNLVFLISTTFAFQIFENE